MPSTLPTSVIAGALLVMGASAGLYYVMRSRFHFASKELVPALNSANFQPFIIHSNEPISHNTHLIRIKLPKGTNTMGLTPVASYLLTNFKPDDPNSKSIVRPYTPVTTEEESQKSGYFELVIKRYQNGPMSTHITSLKPGDTLNLKGPGLKLNMDQDNRTQIGMIAGGTGITPMLQVIGHVLNSKNTSQKNKKISLIFANVEEKDILLKKELDHLASLYPDRFKIYYILDKPSSNWNGGKGHVDQNMIKNHLPSSENGNDVLIMVCGPDGMLKHVCGEKNPDRTQGPLSGLLKDLKYTENQVFKF